ncbi:hypothetical protein SLS62_006868 [Diatrype stigma]|uniref:Uncharacterized protein n=1 Tax=Diatrype stigma TaxID=117547 RepID=A0AAN9UXR4_9PEZI
MPFQNFQLESASGTGAPTFLSDASDASGPTGTAGGLGPFYPSSQANPSPFMSYPDPAAAAAAAGFAPAPTAPMMNTNTNTTAFDSAAIPCSNTRKRKATSQENERLSKRLSLLNLEQNGNKLYVPVENPQLRPLEAAAANTDSLNRIPESDGDDGDDMQLDDTKHKVYIYNLDDELASSSDGESSADEGQQGRLMFLPDIQKHLLQNRIPPSVLANPEGELAGMQLVLYREPASLSVPEEHDSVRRAVIEARHRLREKQRDEQQQQQREAGVAASFSIDTMSDDGNVPIPASNNGYENNIDDDPDAMEMD